MALELLLLFVVWVTVFGLVVLMPWAIIKTMSGAHDAFELRTYRQSLTVPEPVTQPRIEDDSLLVEAEA
ncbi:hypothetical protein [Haladaptatus sp. ZSTT2]|uniref:hypothetical protein n=1 Tax=Haladaptatus sp. ZSTT2 TaxID=3120515 RepID=UPI00300EB363